MKRQTILYKISFCALFTALTIILSRFFSLPGLFGFSFLKISFANSVVLFSSFYLGPLWGMTVGGLSDVLGAILFPQGGAFNPLYTIPALLTGLFPYIFYKIDNKLKFEKKFPFVLTFLFIIFFVFTCVIFFTNESIKYMSKTYYFADWQKYTFISLIVSFSIIYILGSVLLKKKFTHSRINEHFNIYALISSMFLTYMVIKNPISSLISAFLLNYDFLFILFIKLLTGFFICLIHSIIVIFALNTSLIFNNKAAIEEEFRFKRLRVKDEKMG